MLLKEFFIGRYGPLPEGGRQTLSSFNLFYGPNEDGKTLTLDAFLKMLFGKKINRSFTRLKRVDELPEGYLLLSDKEGRLIKLPADGTMEDFFNCNAREFGSIFVIRDSDLLISREGDLFRHVTGRLTGMRTEEINNIKDQLCELGRITETGVFLNTAPEKLKDKLDKARSLLARAGELSAVLQEDGYGSCEVELAGLHKRRREVEKRMQDLSTAAKRDLYEKGRRSLAKLAEAEEEYSRLQSFSRDDYDIWQHAFSGLSYINTELKRLEAEEKEIKKELQAARALLVEKHRLVREKEKKFKKTEASLQPLLEKHEKQKVNFSRLETAAGSAYLRGGAAFAAAVFLLLLAAVPPDSGWWAVALYIFSGGVVFGFGLLQALFLKKRADLAAAETEIIGRGEKEGLPALTAGEVRVELAGLGETYSAGLSQVEEMGKEMEWKIKDIKRLQSAEEEKRSQIAGAVQKIEAIRRQSGVDSLDQYSSVLRRKENLALEIEKQKSLLSDYFGGGNGSLESTRTAYWQERTAELADFAGAVPHLAYNPRETVRLEAERDSLSREIKDLRERMSRHFDNLRDFEREINNLFQDGRQEEYYYCQTVVDLESLRKKLRCWIEEREKERDTARQALEIMSSLEVEEEEKVSSLFGPASAAGEYFTRITGGGHRSVFYDSRENMIMVHSRDGSVLGADQLSGGTFDQLYFAVRLALGEKILEGEKGFFLLDDAFIKADPQRLSVLLKVLFEINDAGWQILYFSAKEEIKRALQENIDRGLIKEFRINGLAL